ncbi:MAG: flagellar biosynthesis protein FliQ [Nitrospirota bacterium]|nr:flagellar biosynthesis protein FliQ [Nitrospirota bacterium]
MTPEMVTELGRQALETTLLVSAPILGLSLVVGLVVSALQAMTQLNEATLTFVPKLLVVFGAIVVFMPWMLGVMTAFMTQLFSSIPTFVH